MGNPWKWTTLGMMAVVGIIVTCSLTTAYLMRPPTATPTATAVQAMPAVEHRPLVAPFAPVTSQKPIRRVPSAVPPNVTRVAAPQPPVAAADDTASIMAVPPDTGGDRALRVAKPGVLGALLGAGLGAAGGAIANGGKGAGKGALIGGVAGAALGTGYGAYKTKDECGTIFGSGDRPASRVTAPGRVGAAPSVAGQTSGRDEVTAALQASESAERIQVYGVR